MSSRLPIAVVATAAALAASAAFAEQVDCPVSHAALKSALASAVAQSNTSANGGLGLNMWATIVNREGYVCAVAFTGADFQSQWPAAA
jgi:hypothetical protein